MSKNQIKIEYASDDLSDNNVRVTIDRTQFMRLLQDAKVQAEVMIQHTKKQYRPLAEALRDTYVQWMDTFRLFETPEIEEMMSAKQRVWKLRCLQCDYTSGDLVATQEHLINEHGVTQESFKQQVREQLGPDHFRWCLPDGTKLMEATIEGA